MPQRIDVRPLDTADLTAAWELSRLSFGIDPTPPPGALTPRAGLTRYGAFDEHGRLIGKATDLHHRQWWAGRTVEAADVGGVAVAPEARGRGVGRRLLSAVIHGGRDRGAALSILYPTVSAPYRSSGWEIAGNLRTIDLPAAALPRLATTGRLQVRAALPRDLPAVADVYEQAVRHRAGFLTRRGPLFDTPADALPAGLDGITCVDDGSVLVGYAAWSRGRGYGDDAVLTVHDAFALTDDAAAEIVSVLRSWSSVTPTIRMRPVPGDAVWSRLPVELGRAHSDVAWMLRPVDVASAVERRGWPGHVRGRVTFELRDPVAEWNSGTWRLEVADGAAQLSAVQADSSVELTVRGFAALYAGASDARSLVRAGLAAGPAGDVDALDLLGSGRPAQLLDYF